MRCTIWGRLSCTAFGDSSTDVHDKASALQQEAEFNPSYILSFMVLNSFTLGFNLGIQRL